MRPSSSSARAAPRLSRETAARDEHLGPVPRGSSLRVLLRRGERAPVFRRWPRWGKSSPTTVATKGEGGDAHAGGASRAGGLVLVGDGALVRPLVSTGEAGRLGEVCTVGVRRARRTNRTDGVPEHRAALRRIFRGGSAVAPTRHDRVVASEADCGLHTCLPHSSGDEIAVRTEAPVAARRPAVSDSSALAARGGSG